MHEKNSLVARRALLQAGLAALAMPAAQLAPAQDKYPTRAVRIIVPLPPGGVADASVRMLTNTMQSGFGQPLTIDNKPGGGFARGMGARASMAAGRPSRSWRSASAWSVATCTTSS